MALGYGLSIATDWSAARVARLVQETAEAHGLIGTPNTLDVVRTGDSLIRGMGVWVVDERPDSPHPVVADLGVVPPSVGVVFSVYKGGDWGDIEAQEDDMVRIVAGMLAAVPGDAFLELDYEMFWLVRRGDDLVLHEDDLIWTAARLATITQPFRRATSRIP